MYVLSTIRARRVDDVCVIISKTINLVKKYYYAIMRAARPAQAQTSAATQNLNFQAKTQLRVRVCNLVVCNLVGVFQFIKKRKCGPRP